MVIGLGFVAFYALLFIFFLKKRPKILSEAERKSFRIHPDVPSLFKTFDGIEIHYHQFGQGPDLVFLHGLGASTFIFRKILPRLANHFRITAIDMPGFGRSQKLLSFSYQLDEMTDYLSRFLTEVNVETFSLVGSSMGGSIALWISRRARHRCSKVITIAAATHRKLVRHPVALMQLLAPLHFFINRSSIYSALAKLTLEPSIINEEMISGYLLPFRDHGEAWRCFLKSTRIIDDHRMPAELSELHLRPEFQHLMVYGDADKIVPMWVQEELRKVLPSSRFEILPRLGHHPFEEDPAKIIQLIESFLKIHPD